MRALIRIFAIVFMVSSATNCFADHPAFEYYVIKRDRVETIIKNNQNWMKLPSDEFEKISDVHGWLEHLDPCSLAFSSPNFRCDIRTKVIYPPSPDGQKLIEYMIVAGGPKDWNIIEVFGIARLTEGNYITVDWQSKQFVVIFRPINLKR